MAIYLFSVSIVIVLTVACLLMGIAFTARKNAVMTYDWFSAAMDYAAEAANMNRDLSKVEANTGLARQYFVHSFARMTGTKWDGHNFNPNEETYPGPIKLTGFSYTSPGQAVPGGTAKQPGYTATIEVPVIQGNIPFVGQQYITVPMRYLGVIKPQITRS